MSVQRRPEPKPRRTKTTQSKAAPAQSHLQSKAVPVQNHVGQKPRRTKSRIVVPPLPLGSETSASPKDAQLKRLCEAPSAKRTIKGRPAKDTRKTRCQSPPRKRHPTNAPTKPAPHRSPRKKALQTVLRTENRGKIWRSAAKPLSSHIPNDACDRAIFPPQRPFIGKSTA